MSSKYNQGSNITPQSQLIKWLNDAGMAEGGKRADLLRKVSELLLHQCSAMLPEYMENILSFVSDKSTDVKKQVVAFVEEISKQHPNYLPKVIGNLRLFITDTTIAVQKRAIQAASIVYRNTLMWICKKEASISDMQFVWQHLSELKLIVLNMIDSDNEGIRTHSIKFLEEIVLTQSSGDGEGEFCLDSLPNLPFINRKALEEEAEHIFTLLVKFHNSQHISSVNLMACMTTLCLVARERPRYASRVLRALADLHTTLPPTLSASQVNSVRKHLKMLLLNFLKQPSAGELTPQVTQLLSDAGVSAHEISRAAPRRNKRLAHTRIDNGDANKRFRVDSPQSNSQGSDSNSRGDFPIQEEEIPLPAPVLAPAPVPAPVPVPVPPPSFVPLPGATSIALPGATPIPLSGVTSISLPGATSISSSVTAPVPAPIPGTLTPTEDTLMEGLDNIEKVIDLVMATLLKNLPAEMPEDFTMAYSPIPNSGSKAQKKSLAKKLMCLINREPGSTQLISEANIPILKDEEKLTLKNAVAKLQESSRADKRVENAVSKLMEETRQDYLKEEEKRNKEKEKVPPPQTPTVPKLKQKVKLLRLQEITRPIPKEIKERLILGAIRRILNSERDANIGGAAHVRAKFVALFAAGYTPEIRDLVLDHILEAPQERLDLALAWLYEEYAFMQGFNRHPVTLQPKVREKHDQNYNQLLCALVTQIYERIDPDMDTVKEALLRRIYAEAPIITDEAGEYLRHFSSRRSGAPGSNTAGASLALEILDELCATRPLYAHKLAPHALVQILSEDEQTRELALSSAVRLYSRCTTLVHSKLRKVIEKHALLFLGFITLSSPPPELEAARPRQPWTDELYKVCIALVMALFPHNEDLIVEVGRVYGCASPEAKRCILRASEAPLRSAVMRAQATGGGGWPEAFTALMDECPRGSETLLTRLVHIITEREPPSPELVARVRELYQTRVSDVRFLIPVLTGLTKSEILAALPKLIKLNPAVVKEVFNKLLGLQNPGEEKPPVSPSELLVALHLIDPATADLKYIIKATALCFAEKNIYTQDVITGVLQRLAKERSVPVLMMRSVLQALTLYPALAPFVLNLLQLLLEKEVWTHKVAWEGWVKCCERLAPRSVSLLVALPPRALHSISPALMTSLRAHLATLSPPEQALLPAHVADVMAPPPQQEPPPFTPPPSHNPLEPLPPGME